MPAIRAVVEHDDPVGVDDRADALGDDDDRRVLRLGTQRRAQPRVGAGVERREAVVEQVHARPLDERPGDRQPLALAAGDVGAALVDGRVETARHGGDEVARLGDLERVPELGVGRVRPAEAQVVGDRAAEQVGLLRDERRSVDHSVSSDCSRTSTPSTSTAPEVTSKKRGMRLSSVVLPEPVPPMIARRLARGAG